MQELIQQTLNKFGIPNSKYYWPSRWVTENFLDDEGNDDSRTMNVSLLAFPFDQFQGGTPHPNVAKYEDDKHEATDREFFEQFTGALNLPPYYYFIFATGDIALENRPPAHIVEG